MRAALLAIAGIIAFSGCAKPRNVLQSIDKINASPAQISLEGSFHIVFDPHERYFLIQDSTSTSLELLFANDSSATRRSLLSFDRHRVRVTGVVDASRATVFKASHIELVTSN